MSRSIGVWVAAALMVSASAVLALPGGAMASWLGVLAVTGACLCWALDNNLTRAISAADPTQIAAIKGLGAGSFNLMLALLLKQALPGWHQILIALAIGALSYGVSLVLFILALRHLGSARTGAHFGTAPFFGAGFAVLLMGEPVTVWLVVSMVLMALATWLVLTERHEHQHEHEPMAHDHFHRHDAHHQHQHDFPWDERVGHAHPHEHVALMHRHAHLPDLHHRHGHRGHV
jgi:drug/metabolite transporter (DMT)-like permease